MEIHYNLTEQDYLNFNMYHIENSATMKKALTRQRFLTPILLVAVAYMFSIISGESFLGLFLAFFAVGILWMIFFPKYFYSHVARQTRKMIKEGGNAGLLGKHHMIIDDEGIIDLTDQGETKVKWSGILECKEDSNNLYLYNSSVSAYILPKRELADIEQVKSYLMTKRSN